MYCYCGYCWYSGSQKKSFALYSSKACAPKRCIFSHVDWERKMFSTANGSGCDLTLWTQLWSIYVDNLTKQAIKLGAWFISRHWKDWIFGRLQVGCIIWSICLPNFSRKFSFFKIRFKNFYQRHAKKFYFWAIFRKMCGVRLILHTTVYTDGGYCDCCCGCCCCCVFSLFLDSAVLVNISAN